MQKIIPVLISIGIIIGVALLRVRFRAVAALLVTLPINIPLSMWIVSNSADAGPPAVYHFARATVIGLLVTLAWVLIVFLALRAGWKLGAAIAAAYGAWIMLVGVLFALRVLSL